MRRRRLALLLLTALVAIGAVTAVLGLRDDEPPINTKAELAQLRVATRQVPLEETVRELLALNGSGFRPLTGETMRELLGEPSVYDRTRPRWDVLAWYKPFEDVTEIVVNVDRRTGRVKSYGSSARTPPPGFGRYRHDTKTG